MTNGVEHELDNGGSNSMSSSSSSSNDESATEIIHINNNNTFEVKENVRAIMTHREKAILVEFVVVRVAKYRLIVNYFRVTEIAFYKSLAYIYTSN